MLHRLIDFSLRQRFVALSLVALMAFGGIVALERIPINSLPDVTPVQVLIITKAGRYSPYDVEQLVSFPIETAMTGLPRVREVRSISQFGLSVVTVEFEEGTDIYFARQLVAQRLQDVREQLPPDVSSPQLGPISTALGEIYQYVVRGDGYSLTELREIQDWIIAPQLRAVPGVTEVNSFGGFVKQYEVIVDPEQLRALRLSLRDIIDAIERNNASRAAITWSTTRNSTSFAGSDRSAPRTTWSASSWHVGASVPSICATWPPYAWDGRSDRGPSRRTERARSSPVSS